MVNHGEQAVYGQIYPVSCFVSHLVAFSSTYLMERRRYLMIDWNAEKRAAIDAVIGLVIVGIGYLLMPK